MNLERRTKGNLILDIIYVLIIGACVGVIISSIGVCWYEDVVLPPYTGAAVMFGYLAVVVIVAFTMEYKRFNKLRDESDRLKFLAEHDELTGLIKRKVFDERVKNVIATKLSGNYFIAVLDVEKFKMINDKYDHTRGDELLRLIAMGVKTYAMNCGGFATRLFADNFAVLLPYRADRLNDFVKYMDGFIADAKLPFEVFIDYGVYQIFDLDEAVDSMIDKASMAEKTVKEHYSQRFGVYDEKMREKLAFEQWIADNMASSLNSGEFELYIQPQIDYNTKKIASGEALVRWNHDGKMISPGVFVPIFEKNGFITEMDRFIWEEACKLLRKIRAMGLREICISINMSRLDLSNPYLLQDILALIEKYEVPVNLLGLEITESAYVEDSGDLINILKSLKNYGFKLEIDDFGSGYSSLNVLRDMPADVIKTDLKFLTDYKPGSAGEIILSNVMRMSKELNLDIISEGVETKEQADILHSLGCNIMQGYYYAEPMSAHDFIELLKKDEVLGD